MIRTTTIKSSGEMHEGPCRYIRLVPVPSPPADYAPLPPLLSSTPALTASPPCSGASADVASQHLSPRENEPERSDHREQRSCQQRTEHTAENHPRDQVEVQGNAQGERHHAPEQQAPEYGDELLRDFPRSLPVVGSRGHDDCSRDRHEDDGKKVHMLLSRGELLIEAGVEHDDQLEPEQHLDAGQHHAALLKEVLRGLGQWQLFPLRLAGFRIFHTAHPFGTSLCPG